jgi:hypothetical protein
VQFVALLDFIRIPRDRIILKILFYCALRRSELFVLKRKDFQVETGSVFYFEIQRSFCSRTHKIKEWDEEGMDEGQLRHSKAETTRNIYMQHVSGEQYRAVVDLETRFRV